MISARSTASSTSRCLYVEGHDLATILKRERLLTPERALVLVRGVVSGLRAAHEAGVVHRDLKPANIMVDAHDQARIMDFGIARSTSHATTTEGGETDPTGRLAELRRQAALLSDQTLEGAVIGTVEYMPPEQAQGKPVDQRADIYALGLIVYDMLGGLGRAARSDSAISELTARMQEAPPPIRTINPEVPEALEAVIVRCLHPNPDSRYQTTGELEAALQRLDSRGRLLPVLRRVTSRQLAAAAALMLSLLGGTWWAARGPAPVVELPPTSVLISDFDNRAGDPAFDGTLEQTLATALERASFITVYPRRQAQQIATQIGRGEHLDEAAARLISRREGIKVVVTGRVASTGSGYRVTATAIDPALEGQGTQPLATATADAGSKDAVLNAVASVAAELRADLGDTTPESERAAAAETFTAGSLDAMRAYVRGQELNRSGKPREALVELEKAVALDPKFGMAYVQMASSYTNLKMEDKAKANYEEAFKHLDRMTEREKYRSRGVYYFGVVRNYKEAIKTYETLVGLYPADNTGYANLALAHVYDRNIPKAIEMGRKAIEYLPARYPAADELRHLFHVRRRLQDGGDRSAAGVEREPGLRVGEPDAGALAPGAGRRAGRAGRVHPARGHRRAGCVARGDGPGRSGNVLRPLRSRAGDPQGGHRPRREREGFLEPRVEAGRAGGGVPRAREQGSRRGRSRARDSGERP